jgi:hypothetical protein
MQFSTGLSAEARPNAIARGPDGNMWFTEGGAGVGRITPAGVIHQFSEGISKGAEPSGITLGPDGNLWFGEYAFNGIGRITPTGVATEYREGITASSPVEIATGPDGNLWFSQLESFGTSPAEIGRIISGAAPASVVPPAVTGGAVAGVPQQCTGAVWSTWAGLQPASSLFGFDGFAWELDGTPVGSGQSYAPGAAQIGHALSCTETVTYPVLGVTASASSATVTVLAPPAVAAPPPVAPVLGALSQSASKWREGSRLASLSRARRSPQGTAFSFSLSEAASVRLTFTRATGGRRVKGRCLRPSARNRHRPTCKRTVTAGTLTLSAHAGRDKVLFQGRLTHGKLPLGAYTVTATATNAAGQRSSALSLRFTIVR